MIIRKVNFENSLGKENIDVLAFTTIEALEKGLELLTKEAEGTQIHFSYKD